MVEAIFGDEILGVPNVIAFTHKHQDHYSAELTAKAIKTWPSTKVILPEGVSDKQEICIGDIKLRFIKLSHAGKEYKDVEHYGVIIKGANQTILVSGDCEICDEKLLDETQNERIGISIMNFPWVTLRKGRAAIESLIKPKHLIVAHLPFEEDDIYGYFPATEKAIKNMDKAADIRIFHRFLQKECFE